MAKLAREVGETRSSKRSQNASAKQSPKSCWWISPENWAGFQYSGLDLAQPEAWDLKAGGGNGKGSRLQGFLGSQLTLTLAASAQPPNLPFPSDHLLISLLLFLFTTQL